MPCEQCFYLGSTRVYSTGPKPEQNKRLCEDCADNMDMLEDAELADNHDFNYDWKPE